MEGPERFLASEREFKCFVVFFPLWPGYKRADSEKGIQGDAGKKAGASGDSAVTWGGEAGAKGQSAGVAL